MINATPKAGSVQFLPLDTPAHIGEAIGAALDRGYIVKMHAFSDDDGQHWGWEMNTADNPLPIYVKNNCVLVWDGVSFTSMTQDEFEQKYDVE